MPRLPPHSRVSGAGTICLPAVLVAALVPFQERSLNVCSICAVLGEAQKQLHNEDHRAFLAQVLDSARGAFLSLRLLCLGARMMA